MPFQHVKPRNYVGPRVQLFPCGIQVFGWFNTERGSDGVQILEMEIIQRDIAPVSVSNTFHRGLVFTAPRVGKSQGVNGWKARLYRPCHAGSPIDTGAEDIENHRLNHRTKLVETRRLSTVSNEIG